MKSHYTIVPRALKRTRTHALALAAAITALVGMPAWADPGSPIWQDTYNPGFGNSYAEHVTAAGSTVYVAGDGPFQGSPSSNADIRVRAFDIASGTQLWENVWDATGRRQDDSVSGIAARKGRVFIAGAGSSNADGNEFVVRAYDGNSGGVLWEDHCTGPSAAAIGVSTTAKEVFAAGTCPADGHNGVIRAYSADTGTKLWEADDIDRPFAISSSNGRVAVAGLDATGLVLHVYRQTDGKLLWQARPSQAQSLFSTQQTELLSANNVTYLAWAGVDNNAQTIRQIIAYNSAHGHLRWQITPADQVNGLALLKNRLFAVEQGDGALAAAYDASSGALLWEDSPGTASVQFSGSALSASGKQVIIAGSAFDRSVEPARNFLVRAYSPRGALLWQDDAPTTAPLGADALDVVAANGFVAASGTEGNLTPPFGSTHWLVRAYDSASSTGGRHRP